MHLYYFDKKHLEETLREFAGGQFMMKTREGLVFRGKVSACFVPSKMNKRVLVYFHWLSERRLVLDKWEMLSQKWFLVEPSIHPHFLNIGFTSYYFQPDEERVKMWGEFGEVCHFFTKGDHTNLVSCGDDFVPYCDLHKLEFWKVIIMYFQNLKRQ